MASERKMSQDLELVNLKFDDRQGETASGNADTDPSAIDRFPDVDDILERLTVNTKAAERK
ncbi:hypothetical protein TW80_10575 [Loktanella sp. S4079]|nr:hypothetical protein TW80_10575 [Loktanella sp. S4079]